jgi:hypothetical protein
MKKMVILLVSIFNSAYGAPTLFQVLQDRFNQAQLPPMESLSTDKGRIISGRCVVSDDPNSTKPAYFVAYLDKNDPIINLYGLTDYLNYSDHSYFDSHQSIGSGYIPSVRVPLIPQHDGKTLFLETPGRHYVYVRSYQGTLMAKYELFQKDTEVYCYFHKMY